MSLKTRSVDGLLRRTWHPYPSPPVLPVVAGQTHLLITDQGYWTQKLVTVVTFINLVVIVFTFSKYLLYYVKQKLVKCESKLKWLIYKLKNLSLRAVENNYFFFHYILSNFHLSIFFTLFLSVLGEFYNRRSTGSYRFW